MKSIIKNRKSILNLIQDKNQKSKIVNYLLMLALALMTAGCKQPDDLTPPVSRLGLNSITAYFIEEEVINENGTVAYSYYPEEGFTAITMENSYELVVVIPYYYPESSTNEVTQEMLSKMRIRANLDDNVTINPSILYMDMTKDNTITVTDQSKKKAQYTVRAEVHKSSACAIEDFSLTIPDINPENNYEVTGIINETAKVISLLDDFHSVEPVFASLRLSYHATISPDPRITALDYDKENELTVTAHDGTVSVYTVKKDIPPRVVLGIRPGSGKIMFEKKLKDDLGITVDHLTGGIAATRNYVILNTRGENSLYINAKTGDTIGKIDLGDLKENLRNFYTTADKAGNVVICNLSRNDGQTSDGTFKVWRLKNLTGETELFIEWDNSGGTPPNIGRKLGIQGDLNRDAIITAPLLTEGGEALVQSFARWTVKSGALESQTPEIIAITGLEKGWNANSAIIHSSATDLNSDYFVAAYQENALAWINGVTNNLRSKVLITTSSDAGNYVTNAVDYIEFNNAKYATINWVHGQPWGSADKVWLVDVTTDAEFSGSLMESCPAVRWECDRAKYGGWSLTPSVQNINNSGAVALTVSPDGYFLYLYFMFTNGYVVGVQFDCIDM